MTALRKYQRLECGGLWRAGPEAQRRNVTVSFGEASLVISDSRSETPLAHWSLPAVRRRNPGEAPAIYTPDADAGETLEIEDAEMIGALETVAQALRRGRRPRGRMRRVVLAAVAVALGGLAVGWLPGAVVDHAARVLPHSTQVEIGALILADLAREGRPLCGAPLGLRALARLQERLGTGRLVVLSGPGGAPALALPGGLVVLAQPMVEGLDSPEVAAGHVLAAVAAAAGDDPLKAALRAAGLRATVVLLTTGEVPARALRGHGAARLAAPPAVPGAAVLAPVFAEAALAADPYARATGADAAVFAAGMQGAPLRPVLGDGDWVSLQGICQG